MPQMSIAVQSCQNYRKQKSPDGIDVRTYTKYLLQEGNISEKKDLLILMKSRLVLINKKEPELF